MKIFRFNLIRDFRKQAGISQKDLADKVGISQQQLWDFENRSDNKSMTTANLARIAYALGRKTDDFFVDESVEV